MFFALRKSKIAQMSDFVAGILPMVAGASNDETAYLNQFSLLEDQLWFK